jgi:DNA-binding CsgD family transcriptional regulator
MTADPVSKLSEAQKECLRLVQAGYEGKEIARLLEVSPGAVVERLRAARRTLDVGSSREAARLLARFEAGGGYNRHVATPIGIASAPGQGPIIEPSIGQAGSAGATIGSVWVHDDQTPYAGGGLHSHPRLPLPFPVTGRKRNDLTIFQTMALVLALTLALAVAALVSIAVVEQLSKLRLR